MNNDDSYESRDTLSYVDAVVRPDQPPRARTRSAITRILIVDDQEAIVTAFRRMFARIFASRIETEMDPRVAIERALREPFHAVLLDYDMPPLNGVAAFRALVSQSPSMRSRIVMMSGSTDEDTLARIASLGVPFLRKPFSIVELQLVVGSILLAPGDRSLRETPDSSSALLAGPR